MNTRKTNPEWVDFTKALGKGSAVNTTMPAEQATVGDLHASTLKLIYVLMKEGVLILEDNDYAEVVEIYQSLTIQDPNKESGEEWVYNEPYRITSKQYARFRQIIEAARIDETRIKQPGFMQRLIGDVVFDRGPNDLLTLIVFKKLDMTFFFPVPREMLLGNHDMESINLVGQAIKGAEFEKLQIAQGLESMHISIDQPGVVNSGKGLQCAIENGVITQNEMLELIKCHFLPSLRLFSYTLSPDKTEITIYRHSHVGLETMRAIAQLLEVTYQDNTPSSLAKTIDLINGAFHRNYVETYKITELYNRQLGGGKANPLEVLLWYRSATRRVPSTHPEIRVERPVACNGGGRIHWVGGHDSAEGEDPSQGIFNIDNTLGQFNNVKGNLELLKSTGTTPNLMQILQVYDDYQLEKLIPGIDVSSSEFQEKFDELFAKIRERVYACELSNLLEDLKDRLIEDRISFERSGQLILGIYRILQDSGKAEFVQSQIKKYLETRNQDELISAITAEARQVVEKVQAIPYVHRRILMLEAGKKINWGRNQVESKLPADLQRIVYQGKGITLPSILNYCWQRLINRLVDDLSFVQRFISLDNKNGSQLWQQSVLLFQQVFDFIQAIYALSKTNVGLANKLKGQWALILISTQEIDLIRLYGALADQVKLEAFQSQLTATDKEQLKKFMAENHPRKIMLVQNPEIENCLDSIKNITADIRQKVKDYIRIVLQHETNVTLDKPMIRHVQAYCYYIGVVLGRLANYSDHKKSNSGFFSSSKVSDKEKTALNDIDKQLAAICASQSKIMDVNTLKGRMDDFLSKIKADGFLKKFIEEIKTIEIPDRFDEHQQLTLCSASSSSSSSSS